MRKSYLVALVAAVIALPVGVAYYNALQGPAAADVPPNLVMPKLSDVAATGKIAFDETCAACHGPWGTGTDKGPSFLHQVYVASHHGDMAFVIAAQRGVRAHHWPFGNMPAQPHVSQEEVKTIIAFVREVQAANGF